MFLKDQNQGLLRIQWSHVYLKPNRNGTTVTDIRMKPDP